MIEYNHKGLLKRVKRNQEKARVCRHQEMGGSAEIIFSFPTLHIHLLYIQVMDLVLNDERPYVQHYGE